MRDAKEIYKFIKEKNANCETIPYKFIRAVLFNSTFFHETDKIDFKTGYELWQELTRKKMKIVIFQINW